MAVCGMVGESHPPLRLNGKVDVSSRSATNLPDRGVLCGGMGRARKGRLCGHGREIGMGGRGRKGVEDDDDNDVDDDTIESDDARGSLSESNEEVSLESLENEDSGSVSVWEMSKTCEYADTGPSSSQASSGNEMEALGEKKDDESSDSGCWLDCEWRAALANRRFTVQPARRRRGMRWVIRWGDRDRERPCF